MNGVIHGRWQKKSFSVSSRKKKAPHSRLYNFMVSNSWQKKGSSPLVYMIVLFISGSLLGIKEAPDPLVYNFRASSLQKKTPHPLVYTMISGSLFWQKNGFFTPGLYDSTNDFSYLYMANVNYQHQRSIKEYTTN